MIRGAVSVVLKVASRTESSESEPVLLASSKPRNITRQNTKHSDPRGKQYLEGTWPQNEHNPASRLDANCVRLLDFGGTEGEPCPH